MTMRLHKFIAHAGLGSRRRAEQLITEERVRVNGVTVTELGYMVDPSTDIVMLDEKVIELCENRQYIILNKPPGYLSTTQDSRGRATVLDLVSSDKRLFLVGRLDMDSEGLVLLTNDGTLAHMVTHPRYGVTKSYEVLIKKRLPANKRRCLLTGIDLSDGPARFLEISFLSFDGAYARYKVVLAEGRKRQIRRMFQAIGFKVQRLIRIKIGPLSLGQLLPGESRTLNKNEIRSLYHAAGQVWDKY